MLLVACGPTPPLPTPAALAVLPPTTQVMTRAVVAPLPTPTRAAAAQTPSPTPIILPPTAVPPTATAPTATPLPQPSPAPGCTSPGHIEQGTFPSAVTGGPFKYRVYLPPCYGEDGRVYPTLTMIGGNIHDDGIWDALGLDEAAEAGIADGSLPPLIIVMPDAGWLANNTSGGPASYESLIVGELLPHIESQTCAWPAREGRAIGGLSRGGYWSLEIAFRNAGLFRSVGSHSPALIDSFAGPDVDPVSTGVANDLGGLRILVDIGDRDPYLRNAQPLHDALTAGGVAHDWRVGEGGHDEAYWRARVSDYLAWYADGWRIPRESLPLCE